MKLLKYILISTAVLFISNTSSFAQQVNTLYFMNSVPQAIQYNPAKKSEYKWSVSFPVTNISANVYNQFNLDDVTYQENNKTYLDIDGFLNKLDKTNEQYSSVSSELFGIYFQKDRFGVNLTANVSSYEHLTYSKDLFKTVLKGPAQEGTLGNTQDFNSIANIYAFYDISLGGNYKVNDKFVIGARMKLMFGTYNIKAKINGSLLQGDGANMPIDISGNVDIEANGLGDIVDADGQIDIDDEEPLNSLSEFSNVGFAVDLGAVYQYDEKLTFEASVRNLGAIFWQDDRKYNYNASLADLSYSGMNPTDILNGETDDSFPTFSDSLVFKPTDGTDSKNTTLPTTVNLAATYEVWQHSTAGALFSQTFYEGEYYPSLTLSIDKQFGKFFGLGLSYTMDKASYANVGALVSFGFPGFQMYVVSDNLITAGLQWDKAKTANLRFGVNLPFGKVENKDAIDRKLEKRLN
ncbi:hypothetical protein EI427_03655 [Flammeovirga pectinis]|uniref:DUF5723 domain-containing protein n=1 Tax=Flammeovirga pectinis TaxID=2494373 RepID=A0A3S9NZI9_9BACT|nr:DUF5723 family protein [Flammeovirga pectinis]AZQ61349.1 hypothetical protein EI427_03655 [Flammeovirga pectinis]